MKSGWPRYRFGPFVLIPAEHVLLRDDEPVHLARRDFDLLVVFVERSGHLLRKEELLERLWPDTVVEEGNLTKHVSTLRKALGDSEGPTRLVETVPRVGFRFTGNVTRLDAPDVPERTTPPRVSWRIAAVVGAIAAIAVVALGVSRMARLRGDSSPAWTSLAVLPFTTLAGEDTDRLGLGLADGIITRLSGQRILAVRSTSAVSRYLDANRPNVVEIGRALNVDVVLEGHIQRARETVRVTVQLIDVRTGSPVWAETVDQPAAELFRLEDALAGEVAGGLRLRLAAADQQRLRRRYTDNAEAYAAYVQGRDELFRYTPADTRQAIAAFERALTLDPNYTLARAGLAMASADMYLRFSPERELKQWGERAEREAIRALDLDPDLAEAHLARSAVSRKREFDWDQTIVSSRRASVLNPNLDQPYYFRAAAFYHLGLMDRALAEMDRGRRVGGADLVEPTRIDGLVALFSGQFDLARKRLEEVSRHSSRAIGDTYLALASYYSGDAARGRRMLEQLTAEPSASTATRSRAALAGVLAALGESAEARKHLDSVLASEYRDHHVSYGIGVAFAQLGEADQAIKWLREAVDTGFPCVTWYLRDPLLDPVRKSPAFEALIADLTSRRDAAVSRYTER